MSTFPQGQGFLPDQTPPKSDAETQCSFIQHAAFATDALQRANDAAHVAEWATVNRVYLRDQITKGIQAALEAYKLLGIPLKFTFNCLNWRSVPYGADNSIVFFPLEPKTGSKGGDA